MKGKKNQTGLGLIVALVMSIVLVTIAVFLLTKIVPFSRTVRGMQDSLQARYESTSGAEKGLLMFYFQENTTQQGGRRLLNNPYSNIYFNSNNDTPSPTEAPFYVKSLTREIPLQHEGDYYGQLGGANDWNKIVPGQSIFLNVTGADRLSLKDTVFRFEAPSGVSVGGTQDEQMFLISLSGIEPQFQQNLVFTVLPEETLLGSEKATWEFGLNSIAFEGVTNRGEVMTPTSFFDGLVYCDSFCSIEVSLIGDIGNNQYLRYQIETGTFVPDINALLVSRGEGAGYAHTFYGSVPQQGFISGISFATQ